MNAIIKRNNSPSLSNALESIKKGGDSCNIAEDIHKEGINLSDTVMNKDGNSETIKDIIAKNDPKVENSYVAQENARRVGGKDQTSMGRA